MDISQYKIECVIEFGKKVKIECIEIKECFYKRFMNKTKILELFRSTDLVDARNASNMKRFFSR